MSAAIAALALAAGCSAAGLSLEDLEIIEKRKEAVRQNELQLGRLKQMQDLAERQFLEIELKRLRSGWMRQALAEFQAGNYPECLAVIDRIFNPPPGKETVREPVFDTDSAGNPTDRQKTGPDGKPAFILKEIEKPFPAMEVEGAMEADLRALVGNAKFQMSVAEKDCAAAADLLKEAIVAYRQAQAADPRNRPARRNLGRILFQQAQRDPANALSWYRQALREWQDELSAGFRDAELMVLVGQALYETGRKEASLVSFELAIPEMPDNRELVQSLCTVYAEVGKLEESLRLCSVLLEADPWNASCLTQKARVLVEMGRSREAIEVLETLVYSGKAGRQHLITLGELYAREGLPGPAADFMLEALGGAEKASAAGVEDALFLAELIIEADRPASHSRPGRPPDLDAAEQILRARAESGADEKSRKRRAEVMFCLGRLYQARLRPENPGVETRGPEWRAAAVDAYRTGLSADDTDGSAWLALGDLCFCAGQKDFKPVCTPSLDEALKAYTRASALPETAAEGHVGVGDVLYSLGDFEKARASYSRALDLKPGDPVIAGALESAAAHLAWKRGDDKPNLEKDTHK